MKVEQNKMIKKKWTDMMYMMIQVGNFDIYYQSDSLSSVICNRIVGKPVFYISFYISFFFLLKVSIYLSIYI